MSEEHRQANSRARFENKAVSRYLKAIEELKPRRGRQVTVESLQLELQDLEHKCATATPLKRVQMIQQRLDIEKAIADLEELNDFAELEESFIEVVASYSARKQISYAAWREVGVPVSVLKQGGVT